MNVQQEDELTGGADTNLHSHPFDRAFTHNTLDTMQGVFNSKTITAATYPATYQDDYIFADTTANPITITLPFSRGQKEMQFIRIAGGNNLTVQRAGAADSIDGAASFVIATSFAPRKIKAFKGHGWLSVL